MGWEHISPNFTEEATEAQRDYDLPKVTQLIRNRSGARIWPRVVSFII